jgi:hypothetical protein
MPSPKYQVSTRTNWYVQGSVDEGIEDLVASEVPGYWLDEIGEGSFGQTVEFKMPGVERSVSDKGEDQDEESCQTPMVACRSDPFAFACSVGKITA